MHNFSANPQGKPSFTCFAMELKRNRYGSSERDSLLPLDSTHPKPGKKTK